jgi:hypothetical protein
MSVNLPPVLGEYFAAANAHDPDRVAGCFTEDARVHDEGHDISGRTAIRAWADETGRKYRFTADVLSIEETAAGPVVTATLTGTFPGSPADLRYRFELSGGRVSALEIG